MLEELQHGMILANINYLAELDELQGVGIGYHIVRDLGKLEIKNVTRETLQWYLERKSKSGLSHSVVHHLRWDFRAIFRFAFQDGLVNLNAG
jgi:hypothetical protein